MIVYVSNTNLLELYRLKSVVDGQFIEDAVVTATIVDLAGVEVPGQVWPLTLDAIPDSPSKGDYRGVISADVEFEADTQYVAIIDANAGSNRKGHWEVPFYARSRSR